MVPVISLRDKDRTKRKIAYSSACIVKGGQDKKQCISSSLLCLNSIRFKHSAAYMKLLMMVKYRLKYVMPHFKSFI